MKKRPAQTTPKVVFPGISQVTLSTRSKATQDRILGAAESLILEKGFVGTGIDEIVSTAVITKSGFSITIPKRTNWQSLW